MLCVGFASARPPIWETLRRYRSDLVVLIYEPDPTVAEAAELLAPDGKVAVTSDLVHLRSLLTVHLRPDTHVETLGDDGAAAHGEAVKRVLDEALRFVRVNEATMRTNAQRWTDIGLAQLRELVDRPCLQSMPACLRSVPGVIVGAGPSLDRCLDTLRAMQDRAAIFAVNSSVLPLDRAGILPAMVVALEQQGLRIAPTLGARAYAESVLIPGIHVWPGIWEARTPHVLPALQAVGPVGTWLVRRAGLKPLTNGGSVTTLAYRAAEILGCDPIILVGCDCARTPDGAVYAAGAAAPDHRRAKDQTCSIHVPAWGGRGEVPTTPALSTFREWFESVARQSADRGGPRHINASVGGAHIDRWEELPLFDVPFPARDAAPLATIIEAMGTAPRLDRRLVLRALSAELVAGRKVADLAEAMSELFDRSAVDLKAAMSFFGQAEILAASGVPQMDEIGNLVSCESLTTSATVQRRVAAIWPAIEAGLTQAIEELRRGD